MLPSVLLSVLSVLLAPLRAPFCAPLCAPLCGIHLFYWWVTISKLYAVGQMAREQLDFLAHICPWCRDTPPSFIFIKENLKEELRLIKISAPVSPGQEHIYNWPIWAKRKTWQSTCCWLDLLRITWSCVVDATVNDSQILTFRMNITISLFFLNL